MKTMTCNQLGWACEKIFSANTFEEIVEMSKQHWMEMFQTGDSEHLEAMNRIKILMNSPEAMWEWFNKRKSEFEASPEDD